MKFYKKLDYFNKNLSNLMFDHSKKAMNKMSDLIGQNKKLLWILIISIRIEQIEKLFDPQN